MIRYINGASSDNYDALQVKKAIMCKILRCRPSELDEEYYEDIEMIEIINKEIGKDNPLWFI